MSSINYTENQVARWLGVRTVARARDLVASVQHLQWQNTVLTGDVQGRKAEPFNVIVHFSRPQGRLRASGECTCAVQNNCRHVAAVMLANLRPVTAIPDTQLDTIRAEPVPVVQFESRTKFISGYGHYGHRQKRLDFAAVSFDYAGVRVEAGSQATRFSDRQGKHYHVERNKEQEQQWLAQINQVGLCPVPAGHIYTPVALPATIFAPETAEQWRAVLKNGVPSLRRHGWRVSVDSDFTWNFTEVDAIEGRAIQADDGWFDLELTLKAGRRRVNLEPLLSGLFANDRRWLGGNLQLIADDETLELRDQRDNRLLLTAGQLKPMVGNLIDLLAQQQEQQQPQALRLPAWDVGRLGDDGTHSRWVFDSDNAVHQLTQRLEGNQGVQMVVPPTGLQATLRDYQLQGVSWMQFLRQYQLAGVLADDMGLGKTIQTLAHLLLEKEAGRLDKPALIIVPTTLVHNWCSEARRFTPDLRVLALTGPQRKTFYDQLDQYDVLITTYPLLWRDQPQLIAHSYHYLILDEAQYVKNSASRAATVIRGLKTRHRLCLTGTPLENHLGELWAQFDFLLPGFLGSERHFLQEWRVPIERHGDTVRRELLAKRVRPFMLRRRKQEVAKELPPKNTIVRSVELEGNQRDLYDQVRLAMQDRVQLAMQQQSAGRSHLVVLDALLKLRQICCDPRLVEDVRAEKVKHSAKLKLLREMLHELLAEDRKILIFSQFTSMLSIIAEELQRARIDFAVLTGSTRDRNEPVRRFQQGEVPVFLISLKAGGVGLNLTAADTVIHYDPWWNPAAENQATDRAYRLGQDKPVFVYKLIAADTIEEKVVALQQHKAELAGEILADDLHEPASFTPDDLTQLFN